MIDIYGKHYPDGIVFKKTDDAKTVVAYNDLDKQIRLDYLEKKNKELELENRKLQKKLKSCYDMIHVFFEIFGK